MAWTVVAAALAAAAAAAAVVTNEQRERGLREHRAIPECTTRVPDLTASQTLDSWGANYSVSRCLFRSCWHHLLP